MWRAKDGDSIRAIQDGLECCGFATSRDMPFPFPTSGNGGGRACEVVFGRTRSCIEGWRGMERMVAGMMVGVAAGVFLWMVVIVATPAIHPSSIRETMRLPYADADDENQRTIGYGQYSDDPDVQGRIESDDPDVRREIDSLNSQSQLALHVEGSRVRPSSLIDDSNKWRESPSERGEV